MTSVGEIQDQLDALFGPPLDIRLMEFGEKLISIEDDLRILNDRVRELFELAQTILGRLEPEESPVGH